MPTAPIVNSRSNHAIIALVLLVLAVILGGGGSPNPRTELWLQLLAAVAAIVWCWAPGKLRLPDDRAVWALAIIVIALPVLQLVPLPPSVWSSLPGREAQYAALELVGAQNSWQPLTMSGSQTLASLLTLIAPVLLLVMTAALSPRQRYWLIAAIAALAVLTVMLGALQLSSGGAGFRLYQGRTLGIIMGFQANRNSTVDVLLIGLLAIAAYAASKRKSQSQLWFAGGAVLVVIASVLTASRAGILLLIPAVFASIAIIAIGQRHRAKRLLLVLTGSFAAFAAGGYFLLQTNPALQRVAERFGLSEQARPELWTNTVYAAQQFWPFGSGMGTFTLSYIGLEPLDAVDGTRPNRAHNDYLELMLEAGVFGLVVLAVAAALILLMAVRAWKDRKEDQVQIAFAMATLLIVAVHSVVDYPMRSMSLACLAAVAVGILARPTRRERTA